MISDYLLLAVKNLKKRKLRVFLTLIGILISIATIFVLISASLGLEQAVQEQFRLLGTDKFFIMPRGQLAGPGTSGAVSLADKDVKVIEKVSGIKKTTSFVASPAKIEFSNQIRYTNAIGVDLETADLYFESGTLKVDEGRLLKKGDLDNIMIGSQYKYNALFKKPVIVGDSLLLNDKYQLKVRGILSPIGNSQDDRQIYIPIDKFREIFNIPDRIDQIVVQVQEGQDIKDVASKVEKKLRQSRDVTEKTQDFSILTPEELLTSFGTILNIITGFLLGIAAISLLVGGIGIANTMFTSVLERTREIGIMKAIGAKNSDILLIFLIEAGMLGLIGGVAGVLAGTAISKSLEYIAVHQLGTTLLRSVIPSYLVIGSLAFAFIIGSVSGIWPAWKATQVRPVEALRYE